jgi:hypothetical protein
MALTVHVSACADMCSGVTQKGIPLVTASNVTAFDEEDMDIFSFNLTAAEMNALDHFGVSRKENVVSGAL